MTRKAFIRKALPYMAFIGVVVVVTLLRRAYHYWNANQRTNTFLKTLWMELQYFFNL